MIAEHKKATTYFAKPHKRSQLAPLYLLKFGRISKFVIVENFSIFKGLWTYFTYNIQLLWFCDPEK